MVAAARGALKLVWRIFACLLFAVGLFALCGWIGSSLPRNPHWQEPVNGIEIMVETNGIHTALVLPAANGIKDWRTEFPLGHIASPDRPYTHVSVSWGEREVFLDTPTWKDLKFTTVLRVLGLGGEGLLHVAHYVRPAPDDKLRVLRLRAEEYRRLADHIEEQIRSIGKPAIFPGYGAHDVFYETGGRYTLMRNCNQWTSDMLAEAGVRIGRWTPFAGGVMKWVAPSRKR